MGSQLRWLERTPDKREVDGSIPFEPTKTNFFYCLSKHIEKYIDKLMKVNQHIKLEITRYATIKPKRIRLDRCLI